MRYHIRAHMDGANKQISLYLLIYFFSHRSFELNLNKISRQTPVMARGFRLVLFWLAVGYRDKHLFSGQLKILLGATFHRRK